MRPCKSLWHGQVPLMQDVHLGGLYLLMAAMLLAGSLIGRRGRMATTITGFLTWVTIFGAGFVLFTFRDDLNLVARRLQSEALGSPIVQGKQIRVPMAIDGHFWVEARVNGVPVKFLVDSGASVTTLSHAAAEATGLALSDQPNQLVRTGNGIVQVYSGRADRMQFGKLERRRVLIYVTDQDDLNVLGMNVLSSLTRWSVEGRWLILEG
jgi:aspartyl protease family protein